MTKIDFYILNDREVSTRYRMACRITEKAHSLGHRVHVHTDNLELSQQLDDLLWTFRDRSFIPHVIAPVTPGQYSVTIGHGWVPETCDVLINLASNVPDFFDRFTRVAEIINQDKETRESGRKRYRLYRDHGCPLTHHHVKS